jgi:hypothetical protein
VYISFSHSTGSPNIFCQKITFQSFSLSIIILGVTFVHQFNVFSASCTVLKNDFTCLLSSLFSFSKPSCLSVTIFAALLVAPLISHKRPQPYSHFSGSNGK